MNATLLVVSFGLLLITALRVRAKAAAVEEARADAEQRRMLDATYARTSRFPVRRYTIR